MPESMSAVTLWFVAGLLAVLGFFIRFQGRMHLVAGFDSETVENDAALANLVGGLTLLVGALTAVLGGAVALKLTTGTVWGVYTAVVLVSTAGVALRARRY
ncbi:hypothetical protein [Halorussus halophilus]|uniref:hypothetical protein n=1 Tax=Halorussus halophilus TaxID=2650975 RepID=UPI001300D343|nr:hypothetical protein [Halorussus halophilus]